MQRRFKQQQLAKPYFAGGHSPSILLNNQRLTSYQLENRHVNNNVIKPAVFSRSREDLTPNVTIPTATIRAQYEGVEKTDSTPVTKHVVKNVVAQLAGKGIYGDSINTQGIVNNIIAFGVGDMTQKSGITPDQIENILPLNYRNTIIRTGADVIVDSIINMRTPTLEKLIIFGLSEFASDMI